MFLSDFIVLSSKSYGIYFVNNTDMITKYLCNSICYNPT